jgi:hypothetical protein
MKPRDTLPLSAFEMVAVVHWAVLALEQLYHDADENRRDEQRRHGDGLPFEGELHPASRTLSRAEKTKDKEWAFMTLMPVRPPVNGNADPFRLLMRLPAGHERRTDACGRP